MRGYCVYYNTICRNLFELFVNKSSLSVTVHIPPPCAPFSAVERGKGSPRRRFCCFGHQQRWLLWKNDNKYMTE